MLTPLVDNPQEALDSYSKYDVDVPACRQAGKQKIYKLVNGNDQGGGSFPREKVQGEWNCSECGKAITELPFQPTEGRPVYCLDCYRNRPRRNFRDTRTA